MNKLTKVGCSALCGSLAAISAANAGEMTVTGGADMTWVSHGATVTGNPIGIGSNLTFKGSGELDNGWTYDLTVANANANAFSAATINLDMGGFGSLNFDQGASYNGIKAYDDKMPTAWEESWGAGMGTGIILPTGAGTSHNIKYTTPKILGITIAGTLAPQYGATDNPDKTQSGPSNSEFGKGKDVVININPSFGTEILSDLNIFAGAAEIETQGNSSYEHNQYDAVAGITLSLGPVSIGRQMSGHFTGIESVEDDYNGYRADAFGVAFNVNDNLSLSYGGWDQRKAAYTRANGIGGPADRNTKVRSFQVAMTMGGASVRLADIKTENNKWVAGADDHATVISLGLAF
jgi:outer membrane protein OmpU